MSIIDTLLLEHSLIRRYLDNVSVVLGLLKENKRPPKEFFILGLDFTKTFSDKFHHSKEEYSMFMELAKIKKGEIDNQITSLRDQHERARNMTVEVARSIDGYGKGDEFHAGNIYEYLGYYNHLLRLHIHREDHVFFPMVNEVLVESEQAPLEKLFQDVEEKYGADFFAKSEAKVAEMESLLANEFGEEYRKRMNAIPDPHL